MFQFKLTAKRVWIFFIDIYIFIGFDMKEKITLKNKAEIKYVIGFNYLKI